MFNLAYLKTLGERAVAAFASSLAALLTAGAFDLLNAPWEKSLATAGMAALVTVLISVGGGALTTGTAPALTSKKTEKEVAAENTETPYL
jgi:hypothetical protein